MPGYTEGQVEPRAADPYCAAVDPGASFGAEPRRPARQRRRRAVESERDRSYPERQGVDAEVCHGQLNAPPVPRAADRVRHDDQTNRYIIIRVQVMLYTLDRVTCEETQWIHLITRGALPTPSCGPCLGVVC